MRASTDGRAGRRSTTFATDAFDIPDGGATLRRKLAVRQIDHCPSMADLGIDHVVLRSGPAWTVDSIRECAAVVDALADVPARRA